MSVNICPRCHKHLDGFPAMSRTDNRTDICSDCGLNEGLEAMAGVLTPQSDWPIGGPEWGLKVAQDGSTNLVLIIPTDEQDPQNYQRLRNAIGGGFIEVVRLADDLAVICDEEGKVKHQEINIKATQLASAIMLQTMGITLSPDVLVGDVVFIGWDGSPITRGLSKDWITGLKRQGFWPANETV